MKPRSNTDDDEKYPTGATVVYVVLFLILMVICGLLFGVVIPWLGRSPHAAVTMIAVVMILSLLGGALASVRLK